jgi:hypothetical protein
MDSGLLWREANAPLDFQDIFRSYWDMAFVDWLMTLILADNH